MKINQREFDKVYTITYTTPSNGIIVPNKKNYFSGYPFLRYIKPKAISINNLPSIIKYWSYLSINDKKENTVIFNYPFNDLYQTDNYPFAKLRLFNIDGVDLLNSYWLYTGNPITYTSGNLPLFTLSFYY